MKGFMYCAIHNFIWKLADYDECYYCSSPQRQYRTMKAPKPKAGNIGKWLK